MKNYLTPEQSSTLHQKLLNLKQETEELLKLSEEAAKPVDLGLPIGRISRMDAIQDQSLIKATRENIILKSKQIDASLLDFGNGRYGLCRMCDKPIGFKRLEAVPESPFCLTCKTSIEKKSK